MAKRKSAIVHAPRREGLDEIIEKARTVEITDDQLRKQRASFIYGNAPQGSRITKDSAMAAVDRIRLREKLA